jgi:hypothetical protein
MYTRKYHQARMEEREMAQARADDDQVPAVGLTKEGKVLWRVRPRYRFLDDVKKRNKAAGQFFFEPDTMRFFSSRVQSSIYVAGDGRAYFVTSERDTYRDRQPRRLYTVRVAQLDGSIDTVGDFQGYETGGAAHTAARKAAQS